MGIKTANPLYCRMALFSNTAIQVLLLVTIALSPMAGVFLPLAIAPLLLIIAAAFLAVVGREMLRVPSQLTIPFVVICGLILWSALSLFWTIDLAVASDKLWRHASVLMAGILTIGAALHLPRERRSVLSRWLALGFLAAVGALLIIRVAVIPVGTMFPIDGLGEAQLIRFNRGATVIAILVWPTALYASRFGSLFSVMLVVATGVMLATFASAAAALAMIVGVVVGVATRLNRKMALAAAIALAAIVLSLPTVALNISTRPEIKTEYWVVGSGYHRLLIWKFAAEHISERPLLGWGFDASRSIHGREARLEKKYTAMPLHPHNAALQLWLELGAIGTLIAVVLIVYLGHIIGTLRPAAAAASAGCFASASTICLLSYGIWQTWWVSALFLATLSMVLAVQDTDATAVRLASVPTP
jgi:O-antigen ligase